MNGIAKCGNYLIVSVNSFFGVIGLTFLVGGCLLRFKPSLVSGLLNSMLGGFKDALPGDYADKLDLGEILSGAFVPFIIIGCLLVAIVTWAFVAACCKIKWMLIVYVCFLAAVLLGEVAAIVIITRYRYIIDEATKASMKQSISDKYTGDNGTDSTTLAWNAIMGMLKCCGADGRDDFQETSAWDKIYNTSTATILVEAPLICCVTIADDCSSVATSLTNSYNQGCYDALWDLIDRYKYYMIGILAGVGAFHLLLVFLVIWLIRALWKDNKVAPEQEKKDQNTNF